MAMDRPHGNPATADGAGTRVAVLMTCHDRRNLTLDCLRALESGAAPGVVTQVFLVDDGSLDGTSEVVRERFPGVQIERGDGSLFWGGGMRRAFEAARASACRYDYDLWLNDDTVLMPDAVRRLVATHQALDAAGRGPAIVVGSTRDPGSGRTSYGGLRRLWPLPLFRRVRPTDRVRPCATMNGNVVLVPRPVADRVGNIDPAFTHLRGDLDYGLRARRLGVRIYVAPGFHGTCRGHPVGAWHRRRVPVRERRRLLHHPKYALDEKLLFAKRHFGPLWPLSLLSAYASLLIATGGRGRG